MSISYIPDQQTYKEMTPFKRFVLQSFPWINENFDALTNYELMGKIIEYLNNIISNENAVQSNVTSLYNYVKDYFENLDVTNEINEKLDEMANDGTLTELIENYMDPYIDEQNSRITTIENEVSSISSGSPAGIYDTVEDLTTADPDHSKIYIVLDDGFWYYYSDSQWNKGSQYQSTGIAENSIGAYETNENISRNINFDMTAYSQNYNNFAVSEFESGYITPSNGNNEVSIYTVRNKGFHTFENKQIIFKSDLSILRWRYYAYNGTTFDSENSSAWLNINTTFTPRTDRKYRLVIGTNNSTAFDFNYLKKCGFFYTDDYIENNINEIIRIENDNINNFNINYDYMPFSANAKQIVNEAKRLSNYEEGTITFSNGNNLDGFANSMRNKKAIEIKNCIIINLKPSVYKLRLIYYNALGGHDSQTYQGSTGWYQQVVTKIQNEDYSNHSKYSRLIIYAPNETKIDFADALNNILVINTEDKINFKKPFIDIMAHQGGIGLDTSIPSNTLKAFSNCAKYDFTGFETDVRKTSDGVFIISHDVERTSIDNTTINVNETTYATINSMNFYTDTTIRIPTLDETLKNAKINGMKIDIELKDNFSQNDIDAICKLVKQNSMEDHVVFSSFSTDNLLYVRNIFEDVKVIIPMNSIISPSDIETSDDYLNYRTLRSQGKTLLSMTTDTMSGHTSEINTYIENGFGIRCCYYGDNVQIISNYINISDTILFNTEDLFPVLYYYR